MSSCLGFGRKSRAEDTEPLLPQYRDDTVLQREVHQKLHTYQMLRALSMGFMPSNEQLIINLRTLLAADVLNPNHQNLSDSGRLLVKSAKQWLQQFIEMLQHKNSEDQIQDLLWYLSKSRISIDTEDIAHRAATAKSKADTAAGKFILISLSTSCLHPADTQIISIQSYVGRSPYRGPIDSVEVAVVFPAHLLYCEMPTATLPYLTRTRGWLFLFGSSSLLFPYMQIYFPMRYKLTCAQRIGACRPLVPCLSPTLTSGFSCLT